MFKIRYTVIAVLVVLIGGGALWALSSPSESGQTQNDNRQAQQSARVQPASGQTAQAWFVRCGSEEDQVAAEEAGEPKRGRCEMFQRLSVQETGQRVAELAIGYPQDADNARGVFILPLGILLPPGVTVKIDDNPPLKFDVRYCDGNGCHAHVTFNERILDMMRGGNVAMITLQSADGQSMQIPMSLNGFSKALGEIS